MGKLLKVFTIVVLVMILASTIVIICSCGSDETPPVISEVSASDITETSAVISWTTDEPATSEVEYGLTTGYGSTTTLDEALVINHRVTLTGLTGDTTYHCRVKSKDAADNERTFVGYFFSTAIPPDQIVTFPDPNLEATIRGSVGKIPTSYDITKTDLAGITQLYASEKGITDLTGLEFCTNLTHLQLAGNEDIMDFSPLSGLTKLIELDLSTNKMNDISILQNLTNLTWLALNDNQIGDISSLQNLINLTWLGLSMNQISDISSLAGLTSLTSLGLENNQINDISILQNLTNLDWLYLKHNQIDDIQPLVANLGLSQFDYIDLKENPLSATSLTYIAQLEARGINIKFGE